MVFSNPATRQRDVDYLIDEIQRLGKDLWCCNMNLYTKCKHQPKKKSAQDNKKGTV